MGVAKRRPNWDDYFFGIAEAAARRGECRRSKVACVLVRDNRVIAIGYNGAEAGAPSCLDGACPRGLLSYEEVKACSSYTEGPGRCIGIHAEDNALRDAKARGLDVTGCAAYVTRPPCEWCQTKLDDAGISRVTYKPRVTR